MGDAPQRCLKFIYATDSEGRQYRFYICNAEIIRYIAPDGSKYDFAEGIGPREFGDNFDGYGVKIIEASVPNWVASQYGN